MTSARKKSGKGNKKKQQNNFEPKTLAFNLPLSDEKLKQA